MNARFGHFSLALIVTSALMYATLLLFGIQVPGTLEGTVQVNTLPPPYLDDATSADAPYGPTPQIDGHISPGEYAGAYQLTVPTYGGNLEAFVRQNAITLYVAFDSPHTTPFPFNSGGGIGPAFQVFLDTKHNGGTLPLPDDYRLTVRKDGSLAEHRGSGVGWNPATNISWTAKVYTATYGWQTEYAIDLAKAGITQTGAISIGLALAEVWTPSWPHDWYWPLSAFYLDPSTWGNLGSSSYWSTFYWKPGPYEDYAPSGLPDVDQKQAGWQKNGLWTHCGPVAAANSLWWFDSKFETPDHTPPAISDTYRLITAYGAWDDHDISNVVPLVNDLANNYFGTNQGITGTSIISMFYGMNNYLRAHNLWDDYRVTLVTSPTFQWVGTEAMHSEDVILLLGFYAQVTGPGGPRWARVGGHFVTVAGVDPNNSLIAFSDPITDNQESGIVMFPGRVLSGTLILHKPIPGHAASVHNDAGNVSHDVYLMQATDSPGGLWGPYPYPWESYIDNFGVNPHPTIPMEEYHGGMVQVEVEYALAVSPYTWKASGYTDYSPNGMPDFDQHQDNWRNLLGQWSYCGPVAAANSVWWFDSKFEPNPITPTTVSDHYPLVTTYGAFDDHDPRNVDNSAIAPGSVELIEDLAQRFQTDVPPGSGTIVTNVFTGLDQYLTERNVRSGYVITLVQSPEFWWVAEEVERSEDVILLLGFYLVGGTSTDRVGGHYVTLAGVDKPGGLIAFSDPTFDHAEKYWPLALTGAPSRQGRVATGSLRPHLPLPGHPAGAHNDAGNVSQDVYAVGALAPGGMWGPIGYVQSTDEITNFVGQNGGGILIGPVPQPIETRVEWAVAVSPVADVWIDKIAKPLTVTQGDRITFTLTFSNAGSLAAKDVMITDTLPAQLINPTWSASIPITLITGTPYVWRVPDLAWNNGGVITISGQISAANPRLLVTNTATIATSSIEQYQLPSLPNQSSALFVIVNPNIDVTPTTISITLAVGAIATRPLTVANTGSFTLTWNLAEVPAVTWLNETPINGSVSPGGSTPITATFDTTGLASSTYTTTLRFDSNDPDEPQVDVSITLTVLAPSITVTPTGLAITLTTGLTTTRSITVANLGTAPLNWGVTEVPAVTWLNATPLNGAVALGGQQLVTASITANALSGGAYTTTLRFTSDDPVHPQINVPITLTVLAPHIVVTPTTVALTLTTGVSATQGLTITNSGSANLTWNIELTPTVAWMTVAPGGGALGPGVSTTSVMTFDTSGLSSGVYTTTLRFASDDPDRPVVIVSIALNVPVRYNLYLPVVVKDF